MGWGIVYPPYSVINMGAIQPPTPTTRWVYNFNGVDSYIALPTINLTVNDKFNFKFIASSSFNGGVKLFCDANSSDPSRLVVYLSDVNPTLFRHNGGSGNVTVNGVVYDDGAPIVMDDSVKSVEYTVVSSRIVERIGARYNGTGIIDLPVFDVSINGGSAYNYPINDRTFGAGAPIANSATVLGPELVFNNDFSSGGSGWNAQSGMLFVGGILIYNGVTNDVVWSNVNVEANTTYLFEIKVIDVIRNGGSQPRVQLGNGGYIPIKAVSDGVYKVLLKSTSTGSFPLYIELGAFGSGAAFSVDYVSLKKADGYATGVNLLESGWTEINT